MYLLLAFAYSLIAGHIPPLIPFSPVNKISISVNAFHFTLVFFKAVCHASSGAEGK